MFDTSRPGSVFAAVSPPVDVAASAAEPARVPLERVEAQICELAGHLAAATCRFLVLLGDFDARRGWASWEMGSCAQWLSWKCQMSSGTAREHVRVARALRDLPVIRARFAAGRLSYAKVRALTRIAAPATEAGLAGLAGPMTANQLERFARAHRQVTAAGDTDARVRRRLTWRFEEDGSLSGTFRLPPLAGAVLLKALRAACAGLAGDPPAGVSAETPAAAATPAADGPPADGPAASAPAVRTSSDLADGLVAVAESFLAGKVAGADDAEVYQVVVHAGTGVLTGPPAPAAESAGVSAETPAGVRVPGDPADPARCHVEDGPAISVSTAQMLTCTAALSWMRHSDAGAVLALGRRRRRPSSAIRRAARERDNGRCRFPGCESRRVDLHHIQHWVNGGRTDLDNLISLCPYHHMVVHDRGYLIAASSPGGFSFYRPDGTPLPACPALPEPNGSIDAAHDADITPDTIIPPWYGERLDLDHAIWACFASARTDEEKRADQEQAQEEVMFRPKSSGGDFSTTVEYVRRYYEEHPAA
jgi:HNH endonuclease